MAEEELLNHITSPHQLRRLSEDQLQQVADELRGRIVRVVSRCGGHLASNLGVAELTVAMHYVFDFSRDRLLWDVGHQCYAHKILTGRGDRFETLRQAGGISGFPSPSESPYDVFVTGHAGAAISTAAGLAWADESPNAPRVVAVVGDASIVNGLSLEGINNAALLKRQFLVVLNDNSMAIDRTRGALSHVLDRVRLTQTYEDIKQQAEQLLGHLPLGDEIGDMLRHVRDGLRTTVHGGQVFEALGFRYFGPVDGHDIRTLIRVLKRLAVMTYPCLLHVHTQKGRGCQYAVEDPCRFHSPPAYVIDGEKAVFAKPAQPTWTQVFSDAMVQLGRRDRKVVVITAAMPDGTGLAKFREAFPARYIDVGINESHAVAMAAGLAKAGLKPVVAIYSTFMQRAVDQIYQEAALQNLPVVFCLDRAGLVGADGVAHQGFMDIACLRAIPGLILVAPADAEEMGAALDFAVRSDCPVVIRYPRDEAPSRLAGRCPPFSLAAARVLREGGDGVFLCYGAMAETALAAADALRRQEGLDIGVVNARFAKPLDATLITRLLASARPVVVCEDHSVIGGFGSAVMELASSRGLGAANVRLLGLPDRFIEHASRRQQLAEVGLDAPHLAEAMKDMIRHPAREAERLL
jgi:1-deoxy-D-xylulose-5-phosphate synthase